MHTLSCALPLLNVPARATRGALVAHRHSFEAIRSVSQDLCAPLSIAMERS